MSRLIRCLPALLVFGCWEPHDSTLFSSDGSRYTPSTSGGAPTSAGAGYGAVASTGAVAGSETLPETGGTTGYPSGGSAGSGSAGGGGSSTTSVGGEPAGGEGGAAGSGNPPTPQSCEIYEGSVQNPDNGHCYRVSMDEVDFATAREACRALGGHLVTIGSDAENAFVATLLPAEHWLGATDGLPDTTPGPGTYAWVNDEPWVYSAWQDGQPNAKETGCPGQNNGSCYEHCGFQTDKADWNDRSCWHTIPSVCEWELDAAAK